MQDIASAIDAVGDRQLSARLLPAPHTAEEKAAMAASFYGLPAKKAFSKTRMAFGTAAVVVAVAVPNVSLEAMVGTIGGPYFGPPEIEPERVEPPKAGRLTATWTPAAQVAGPVYAKTLAGDVDAVAFSSHTRFDNSNRELPLAVLGGGSQAFHLAFADVAAPTPLTAVVSQGLPEGPSPLTQARSAAIATRTIAIEQITDLDLVVRAAPENVQASQQSLVANSSSARVNALASRSVEAAFAGAIDASNAVRGSLPVEPNSEPNQPQARVEDVRRAIPVGAPSPSVSATAATEAMLVPKTKLDARVNGVLTGSVDFQQLDGTIAIRLRSIANMMREQFSKTEFARIASGNAIDTFVPLAQLQAAGIPVSYNPAYDEIEFGIDYEDAPNAKKVHVDQISVAPIDSELTAIEQIPR
ncbi:MAG: hypothetical protein AAGI28_14885 [Pseudomonadota bacterium]